MQHWRHIPPSYCLPSPSVGFTPVSVLCIQTAAYLSLQPHTSCPQQFHWPHHVQKDTDMHQRLRGAQEMKRCPAGISGKKPVPVERCVWWRQRWWALRWELDQSPGVGSFSYFRCHECPRCSAGLAGRLGEKKGPICCMRLFQTRYSTGCHLFGETQGRRDYGDVCEWGIEVIFSKQYVFSCPHV